MENRVVNDECAYSEEGSHYFPEDSEISEEFKQNDYMCGVGSYARDRLRPCSEKQRASYNPVMWSVVGVLHWGYYISVITAIEKRYHLPSALTGLISNVGMLLSILRLFRVGSSRPRLLSGALFMWAAAVFLFAAPHFLFTTSQPEVTSHIELSEAGVSYNIASGAVPYRAVAGGSSNRSSSFAPGSVHDTSDDPRPVLVSRRSENSDNFDPVNRPRLSSIQLEKTRELCTGADLQEANNEDFSCGDPTIFNGYVITLFILSMVLQSIGESSKILIDKRKMGEKKITSFPMYCLHWTIFWICKSSPFLGFILGACATSLYVELKEPGFSGSDSRWIGAWWLGFLASSLCIVIWAVMTVLFPDESKEVHPDKENAGDYLQKHIKDLLDAIGSVSHNKLLLLLVAGGGLDLYQLGFITFLPKYLEVHYRLSASKSIAMAGVAGYMSWALGGELSARLLRKSKNLGPSFVIKLVWGTCAVSLLGFAALMDIPSTDIKWAGNINPDNPGSSLACSANCSCSWLAFTPVCGDDGLQYYSPCHAGCNAQQDTLTFSGCSCTSGRSAQSGLCEDTPGNLAPYVIVLVLTMLAVGMCDAAKQQLDSRCVTKTGNAILVVLPGYIKQLLAFPAPLLFGVLIDHACDIEADACADARRGPCLLYNTKELHIGLHQFVLITKGAALVFYTLGVFYSGATAVGGDQGNEKVSQKAMRMDVEIPDILNTSPSKPKKYKAEERGDFLDDYSSDINNNSLEENVDSSQSNHKRRTRSESSTTEDREGLLHEGLTPEEHVPVAAYEVPDYLIY